MHPMGTVGWDELLQSVRCLARGGLVAVMASRNRSKPSARIHPWNTKTQTKGSGRATLGYGLELQAFAPSYLSDHVTTQAGA